MDRTLIAFNIPNLITIPVMAVLGWLLFGLAWQIVKKAVPAQNEAEGAGGY